MERFTFSRHMPRSGDGYGYGYGNGFDLNQPETHDPKFEIGTASAVPHEGECLAVLDHAREFEHPIVHRDIDPGIDHA